MSEDSSPDAVALILPNTPGFLFCSQQNRIEYLFLENLHIQKVFSIDMKYIKLLFSGSQSGNVQRRFNGRLPLVVSLLQVYKRQQKLDGVGLYAIGFEIFQVCISQLNRNVRKRIRSRAATSVNVPTDMCAQQSRSLIRIFTGRIWDSQGCEVSCSGQPFILIRLRGCSC